MSLFVTRSDDIYVNYNSDPDRIDRWRLDETQGETVVLACLNCAGIFIDRADRLYCASEQCHIVSRQLLSCPEATKKIVAGVKNRNGTSLQQLDYPRGIFVDHHFNLYVADCRNNRVQKFEPGKKEASTVAGAPFTSDTLNCPSAIILDANQHIYIADTEKHRILQVKGNMVRCLFGCLSFGRGLDQLSNPRGISFDLHGNFFIADTANRRLLKLSLITNPCSKFLHEWFRCTFTSIPNTLRWHHRRLDQESANVFLIQVHDSSSMT